MPRQRRPVTLQELSARALLGDLWKSICFVCNIQTTLDSKRYLTSARGLKLVRVLCSREFQAANPFGPAQSYLNCFDPEYATPKNLGRLYFLYVILLRPESVAVSSYLEARKCTRYFLKNWSFEHVRKLHIMEQCAINFLALPHIIRTFSNLEVLTGQGDDELLMQVSKFCPRLRIVELACSKPKGFTDGGLVACSRLIQLTSLVLTGYVDNNVTINGISFLLDTVPNLRYIRLGNMNLFDVLDGIYQRHASFTRTLIKLPQYRLERLSDEYSCFELLKNLLVRPFAVALCPRLTSVHISSYASNEDLLALLSLDTLLSFALSGWEASPTFTDGIVPVLRKHGQHLRCLRLDSLNDIHVGVVLHLCPKLETFKLRLCSLSEDWPSSIVKPLHIAPLMHLKTLGVLCLADDQNEPLQYWPCLLSSPCLERIRVELAWLLNDALMQQILENNSFPRLKRLALVHTPKLTAQTLWGFLLLHNPLEKFVFNCKYYKRILTKRGIKALEGYCQQFDLYYFFGYDSDDTDSDC